MKYLLLQSLKKSSKLKEKCVIDGVIWLAAFSSHFFDVQYFRHYLLYLLIFTVLLHSLPKPQILYKYYFMWYLINCINTHHN